MSRWSKKRQSEATQLQEVSRLLSSSKLLRPLFSKLPSKRREMSERNLTSESKPAEVLPRCLWSKRLKRKKQPSVALLVREAAHQVPQRTAEEIKK